MGVLEQIMQMKNQGMGNEEIAASLREQNISPKAITDALNQAEIKNAVSDVSGEAEPYETSETPEYPDQMPPSPQPYPAQNIQEMQTQAQAPEPEVYAPQTPQQEQYYTPEAYPQAYGDYGYDMGTNTDTIIEVSEQVFSEKIGEIKKQLDDMKEFKTLAQTRLDSALERLKRIEKVMDQLQISILKKIGSYGENLESIKKEMSMMQDSFGKMVGPVTERNLKKPKHKFSKTSKTKKISKKK